MGGGGAAGNTDGGAEARGSGGTGATEPGGRLVWKYGPESPNSRSNCVLVLPTVQFAGNQVWMEIARLVWDVREWPCQLLTISSKRREGGP
jgi:hypothetical protein